MRPLILFKSELPKLSSNEQSVLKILVDAAKLIVPIYELQENHKLPGANFYPSHITKQEIEKAAKSNPEILSPYTVVERKNGQLVAIPFHEKYQDLLKPVIAKLRQAAELTDSKDFAKSLMVQADALENGSYELAQRTWLNMDPYILDINIGPMERYDDRLFFTKTSYQAWVGVMDKNNTERINAYKDIILSSRRKILMPSEKVDYYDKVQTRVDNAVVYAGRITRTRPVGINLPNNPDLMEKIGSEITVFKQVNTARVKEEVVPAFGKIFSKEFQKNFSAQDLEDGSLYIVVLHELAHTYLRYRNSEKNLEDLFPIIDELAAFVMGIKVCGSLLLKDIMSQKQLESLMIAFMARCFYLVIDDKDNLARIHYITGAAVFLNFMLESGAVQEEGGISWPNFTKMFVSIEELGSILERMLYKGTRKDAEKFINQYSDIRPLQRFK